MAEGFCVTAEIVVDGEASTEIGHFLEVLHEGKIFSRIFLGLLGY